MPAETASSVTPGLIVSTLAQDTAPPLAVSQPAAPLAAAANSHRPRPRTTLASRRRSKTESSALKATSAEWVDVDVDDKARPGKTAAKRAHRASLSSSSGSGRSRRNTESEVSGGGFLPKLGRILEGTSESRSTSRPSTGNSTQEQSKRSNTTSKRHRRRDDNPAAFRRPAKHRVGGVSSRNPYSGFNFNPSLLSVRSTLTGVSDRSSSSNNTITQASYNRIHGVGATKIAADRRLSETESETTKDDCPLVNVFDYMDSSLPIDDGHDGRSVHSNSSTSSSYVHSDAGSSELPGTPSSHSTFPSPSSTRNPSLSGSVAELRRKYDASASTSPALARTGSHSPEMGARGVKKVARVRTVAEEEQAELKTNSDASQGERANSSRSPRSAHRYEERLRLQEDVMRQHQQYQHAADPTYGQHRSHSTSSHGSAASDRAYAHYMAMQQYHYPSPPTPAMYAVPPPPPVPPPAPDPPDFSQTTIAGYEQLALALSSSSPTIKPCYRQFSYLSHRIALHLQDELSELEAHLRKLDEVAAQAAPPDQPASRRYDTRDVHVRRTELLGRIFLKQKQYRKALAGLGEVQGRKAEEGEVQGYREWMEKEGGICVGERKFLNEVGDLIVPGEKAEVQKEEVTAVEDHRAALALLLLPIFLFAFIPSLVGRVLVAAVMGAAAAMMMAPRGMEWSTLQEYVVAGSAYLLVMAVMAACMPTGA